MTGSKKPIVYWDSCVFIAFLKGDREAEEIKEGVKYWSERAIQGEAAIVTSTITAVEVLRFCNEPNYFDFHRFLQRYVKRHAADHVVCQRAHGIRNHFIRLADEHRERVQEAEQARYDAALADWSGREPGKRGNPPTLSQVARFKCVSTADAIHLATASLYEQCEHFHTFDGQAEERESDQFHKLLRLNGRIPDFRIPIGIPVQNAKTKPAKEPERGSQQDLLKELFDQ